LIDDDDYKVALMAMVVLDHEIAIALSGPPPGLYIGDHFSGNMWFGYKVAINPRTFLIVD
jgi:hypothetical protein